MSEARYAVGIDLGTTHCVMAAIDLNMSDGDEVVDHIELIPQLTAPGSVEERPVLPSFLYLPHPDELRPEKIAPCRGVSRSRWWLANWLGAWADTPIRLAASAKSWLCHPGVDRRAILPVEAPDEVPRISPLDASIRYLSHLRAAGSSPA